MAIIWHIVLNRRWCGHYFLRDDFNFVSNIYTLDIDDPEAEEIALTDYTPNNSERVDSMAYPDDASWVAYIELANNDGVIKKIDLESGEISTLFECDTDEIQGCWLLDISPDGRYMVFGGLAKNLPGAEVAWLINLEDETAPPTLIEDGGTAPARFINNETIAYWAYEPDGVVLYDIATGEIQATEVHDYEPNFNEAGVAVSQSTVMMDDDGNASYDITLVNTVDESQETMTIPFGDPQQPYSQWHPDNIQFLIRAYNFDAEPEHSQIALIDAETGEGQLLVDQAGYSVIGFEWNPDGTQFLFWRQEASQWGYEGDVWIYDMESGEATPLNQIGSYVGWLN